MKVRHKPNRKKYLEFERKFLACSEISLIFIIKPNIAKEVTIGKKIVLFKAINPKRAATKRYILNRESWRFLLKLGLINIMNAISKVNIMQRNRMGENTGWNG